MVLTFLIVSTSSMVIPWLAAVSTASCISCVHSLQACSSSAMNDMSHWRTALKAESETLVISLFHTSDEMSSWIRTVKPHESKAFAILSSIGFFWMFVTPLPPWWMRPGASTAPLSSVVPMMTLSRGTYWLRRRSCPAPFWRLMR